MSSRVGVVVHGADQQLGEALVGAVARGPGLGEVRAVEAVGLQHSLGPAAARLREVCDLVVGIGALPLPGLAVRHDVTRDALAGLPYWAVESWHGLPELHDALADALRAQDVAGARVLLTAPDELLRGLPPEHRVVLRDVAAALQERTDRRATIAVDRSPTAGAVTPTATGALRALVEAHGASAVVRCSLVPGDGPDPDLVAVAAGLGVSLAEVAVARDTHVGLLAAVVRTMLQHAVGPATDDHTAAPAVEE